MGSCCGCQSKSKRDNRQNQRRDRESRSGRYHAARPEQNSDKSKSEQKLCVALFDYVPGSASEVAMKKGDRVQLLSMEPHNFAFVRLARPHGTRGYVALEYLAPLNSEEAEDFFYGNIRRQDAVTVLMDKNLPAGAFLVRNSSSEVRDYLYNDEALDDDAVAPYALSVKDRSTPPRIHHYRLRMSGSGEWYIWSEKRFLTLGDLIAYYQGTAGDQDLPCQLTKCVERPRPPRRELPEDMRDRWREIPREQLKLTQLLGEGRFGEVHKAIWTQPDGRTITVVAKQLKQLSLPDKQMLLNEAGTMKDLRHENVIRLYGVVSASEPYYLVTEFVKNGSLQDYLMDRQKYLKPPLGAPALVDICAQVCRGMAYLARKRLVHRDLAARNVLIDVKTESPFSCVAKVADFGLARTLNKNYVYKMKHETYIATRWLAPEGFDTVFSTETDVWAFGVTMAEIFNEGEDPWGDMGEDSVRERIQSGRGPERPRRMPSSVYEIMRRCCQLDARRRPKFAHLVDDFDELLKSMSRKSRSSRSMSRTSMR